MCRQTESNTHTQAPLNVLVATEAVGKATRKYTTRGRIKLLGAVLQSIVRDDDISCQHHDDISCQHQVQHANKQSVAITVTSQHTQSEPRLLDYLDCQESKRSMDRWNGE